MGTAIKVGEAFIDLTMPTAAFVKDIGKAQAAHAVFAGTLIAANELIGKSMRRIGLAMTAGITVPVGIASFATVKLASAAKEATNVFDLAFGDMGKAATQWAATMQAATGLSARELGNAAADFQLLLRSMDFGTEQAKGLSTRLVEMAVDIGSLRDENPAAMFEKMSAALVGMSKPLRSIGILTQIQTLEQTALNMGIEQTVATMNRQQKTLLIVAAITRQSAVDAGDFLRTQFEFANLLRVLGGQWRDIATAIGFAFLPAARAALAVTTTLLVPVRWLFAWFQKWPFALRGAVGGVLLLVAAIGPLVVIFFSLLAVFIKFSLFAVIGGLALKLYGFIAAQVAIVNAGLSVVTTVAARAYQLLGISVSFATLTLWKLLLLLPVVFVAFAALFLVVQGLFWLFGKNLTADVTEEMGKLRKQIEGADRAAKSLIGQFRILGSLDIAALAPFVGPRKPQPLTGFGAAEDLFAPAFAAPATFAPPPLPIGTGGRFFPEGLGAGVGNKLDQLILEVQGLRTELPGSMGLR